MDLELLSLPYSDTVSLENAINLFQIRLALSRLVTLDRVAYGEPTFVDCSVPGGKNDRGLPTR